MENWWEMGVVGRLRRGTEVQGHRGTGQVWEQRGLQYTPKEQGERGRDGGD